MFRFRKKQKNKNTVQEFIGIETFTKRGLKTKYGELVYFQISPTNISVLSNENIQTKIWHLMQVLSAYPNIEITCLDSCERFDDNKTFMVEMKKTIRVLRTAYLRILITLIIFRLKCQLQDSLCFLSVSKRKRMSRYSVRSIRLKRLLQNRALRLSE